MAYSYEYNTGLHGKILAEKKCGFFTPLVQSIIPHAFDDGSFVIQARDETFSSMNDLDRERQIQTPGLKGPLGMVSGPLIAGIVYILLPDTLAPSARTLATILIWVVVYWITEPIPLPVTALLGSSVCVLAGVGSMREVFAPFAHPIIFLFIGSFFLAEAMIVHGLDRRFGLWLLSLRWVDGQPLRIFLITGCAIAGLSMWISNTAATALMVPIGLGILETIRKSETASSRHETGFLLLLAYGAGVGGVSTIIGTPPNLIGVGLLSEQANLSISFTTWMAIELPLAGVMLAMVYVLLLYFHPLPVSLPDFQATIQGEQDRLGPWSVGERNACLAFGLAVFLWIMPGLLAACLGSDHALVTWLNIHVPKELVPVLASGLLFMLPVDLRQQTFTLTWKQAIHINWGTILLFGGGLTFGHLMVQTTLAHTIGEGLLGMLGVQSVWGLTAMAIVAGIVLTELASNTAAASMMVPVVIAVAHTAGVSPIPPTLGACMGASLAFVLPVSTPPNAIVYGTGLVPITSMARAGLLLDFFGGIVIWGTLRLLCPMLGLTGA